MMMTEKFTELDPLSVSTMAFKELKGRLTVRLLNPEHTEILEKIPHRWICGIVEICSLAMKVDETGKSFLTVTNWMIREWGVSEEELFREAEKASARRNPPNVRPLLSVLDGMISEDEEEKEPVPDPEPEENQLYLATNQDGVLGAGVIMYPGFLKTTAMLMGANFYLLPSSIHEFLLLPDTGSCDYEGLNQMVQTINENEVALREQLSDRVLYYDREREELQEPGTDRCFSFRE